MDGEVPGIGRLMYPPINRDFRNRESRRIETFRRKVESGEVVATSAEKAPGLPE